MKKFSKKLFCLMLVAIMVATAIPFGAFAETVDVEGPITVKAICNGSVVATGELPALNGYDHTKDQANALLYGNVTLEGYTLDASAPSELDNDTKTLKVFVTKDPEYSVVVTGDATATGANKLETIDEGTPTDYGKLYQAMTNAGLSEYLDTDKWTITAAALADKVLTVTVAKKDEAPVAPEEFNYSVAIKTTGGLQLAESKTVSMTEAAAEAVKNNVADAIRVNFPSVYNDLTISTLNTAAASVNHESRTILITVDKQEPAVSHEDEIQVVYDDGTVTYIPRKVGTWYFSPSNLGLDDTWGTTQAKLKIYDANGSRNVLWDSEDNDAFVKATDYKVEVLGINRTVTIYFMKTSTANPTTTDAFATKYYEANTRLGVLPSLPDGYTGWYVGQEELTVDTVYHWKEKSVYAYPGKGVGSGRVHLFIYNKDNELLKNVDVTENVQDNGLITKTGLMKTIEYQTGRKNPTVAGLFDESGWAYYLNNKNSTAKAKSSVDVGRAADRQGTQNIYVVLTNVSGGSNADTSNPKTGDTAMIGTAAIVMALAAVGMGTAFYMKKKELF